MVDGLDPRGQRPAADSERYSAALAYIPPNVDRLVRNASVKPHWIGDPDDHFWYRRETAQGSAFILVNSRAGTTGPAFDHEAVAELLSKACGHPIDPAALPIKMLAFSADLSSVKILGAKAGVRLDRHSGSLSLIDPAPGWMGVLASPDGKSAAFCRDHNIWARDLESGAERQLTFDGAPHFSYGKLPDSSFVALFVKRNALVLPPYGAIWSPDSRWLLVARIDERHVAPYPFMLWAPSGNIRPEVTELRRALLADRPESAVWTYVAIDTATGVQQPVMLPKTLNIFLGPGTVWWDKAVSTLYTTAQDPAYRHAALLKIDVASGVAGIVVEERARTHHDYNLEPYRAPNVHVLDDGKEIVWFSERDGWGHLYLYDGLTGEVIRQITSGPWAVFDIIAVDEERRLIYLSAGGKEAGRNPYYRHLYSVGLDDGEPLLLTPEDADHAFRALFRAQEAALYFREPPQPSIAPSRCFFVDTYSSVADPPVTALRSTKDGRVIVILETADTTALTALGYTPPRPFVEKADDGVTDIHGLIYFPPHFDPSGSYPVIDSLLSSPHQLVLQHQFASALWDWNPPGAYALSQLGFIVVQIEARGSSHRNKAFHDFGYGRFAQNGLIDHVSVLKQLSGRYPSMDLSRVGAYGYSLGAYYTTRALLDYPSFYKAGVAIGGSFHFDGQPPFFIQKWQGPVDAGEVPESYRELDCRRLASRLTGKLLMVTGDLDDVAPAALTLQMCDALIKADKDFDLLIMTGHDHFSLPVDPYVLRRMWDFFLRHLG